MQAHPFFVGERRNESCECKAKTGCFTYASTAGSPASVYFREEDKFCLLKGPVCHPVPWAREPVVQGPGDVPLGVEVEGEVA